MVQRTVKCYFSLKTNEQILFKLLWIISWTILTWISHLEEKIFKTISVISKYTCGCVQLLLFHPELSECTIMHGVTVVEVAVYSMALSEHWQVQAALAQPKCPSSLPQVLFVTYWQWILTLCNSSRRIMGTCVISPNVNLILGAVYAPVAILYLGLEDILSPWGKRSFSAVFFLQTHQHKTVWVLWCWTQE